jgi:F-type H+-transporting ATPase subunit delta
MSRVAGRYAKSLIELAQERGVLQSVMGDIEYFLEATKNRDLAMLLQSPIIAADKKQSILDAIFGKKFDVLTKGFFALCIKKNRSNALIDIAKEFIQQYKDMKGITSIKITTATPLSKDTVEAIRKRFEASSATAKTVEVETAIKPSLIGGFVVEFGDKLYDASVAAKLAALKKQFVGNIYESKIEAHGRV